MATHESFVIMFWIMVVLAIVICLVYKTKKDTMDGKRYRIRKWLSIVESNHTKTSAVPSGP